MIKTFWCDLKLNGENTLSFKEPIEFQKLNVIIGHNGIFKSFIFKTIFAMGNALETYKILLKLGIQNLDEVFKQEFDDIFKWTFFDPETISGPIELTGDGFEFKIEIQDGKLNSFNLMTDKEFPTYDIQPIKYNSKNARTFDAARQYNVLKKNLNIQEISSKEELAKLCEMYPLYDIMWWEGIIAQLKNPVIFDEIIKVLRETFSDEKVFRNLKQIVPDEQNNTILVYEDGSKIPAYRLSSGEQSLLMMTLFSR